MYMGLWIGSRVCEVCGVCNVCYMVSSGSIHIYPLHLYRIYKYIDMLPYLRILFYPKRVANKIYLFASHEDMNWACYASRKQPQGSKGQVVDAALPRPNTQAPLWVQQFKGGIDPGQGETQKTSEKTQRPTNPDSWCLQRWEWCQEIQGKCKPSSYSDPCMHSECVWLKKSLVMWPSWKWHMIHWSSSLRCRYQPFHCKFVPTSLTPEDLPNAIRAAPHRQTGVHESQLQGSSYIAHWSAGCQGQFHPMDGCQFWGLAI